MIRKLCIECRDKVTENSIREFVQAFHLAVARSVRPGVCAAPALVDS